MKFFWGAATSAYQVEGGITNDWSMAGFDAGKAADHFNRYEADFDLAKQLGHNAHRISIEWARIEPEAGKFNTKAIEHYRKVILAMRSRGIEPFVTLWHFTNPVWFAEKGGFADKNSAEYFARYVNFTVRQLKKEVNIWITLNEPMVYASNSYLKSVWPPRKFSVWEYFKVIRNLISAHRKAYSLIHKLNPSAQVGIATNFIYFEEDRHPWHILSGLAEYWWNHYFLEAISGFQDFIGLNYYFHTHLTEFGFSVPESHMISDLNWGIYPQGLYNCLMDVKKYKKPIYITENGIADSQDMHRAEFIREHIIWMERAMTAGADVRGYLHWALLDNYEWEKGFIPRFGLIGVDYRTMERKIRPSAYAYRDMIQKNLR